MKDEHKAIECILEVQEKFSETIESLDVSCYYNLGIESIRDVLWTLAGDEIQYNTEKSKEDLQTGDGETVSFEVHNVILDDEMYYVALVENCWSERQTVLLFKNEYIPEEELYE